MGQDRKVETPATPIIIPSPPLAQLVRVYNIIGIRPLTARGNDYNGKVPQETFKDAELYKSSLGTPVVIDLTFESVEFTDFINNRQSFTDQVRLECVLCTVSRPSVIVKTQVNGRNGTVKEFIAKDDHQVTINGIIVGPNGQFPVNQIIALRRIADAPVPIPVTSRYLNTLGVFNIVIEDFNAPQEAGGLSRLNFSIQAVSDEPLQLQFT